MTAMLQGGAMMQGGQWVAGPAGLTYLDLSTDQSVINALVEPFMLAGVR